MNIANWLDLLENKCGPGFAWAVAVLLVATGLPVVLLWHCLLNTWRQPPASGQPRHAARPSVPFHGQAGRAMTSPDSSAAA
jgi:hypothetical protein